MPRFPWLVLLALGLVPTAASAQVLPAREAAARREQLDRSSAEWFDIGVHQVRRELEWNAHRARRTAEGLVEAVRDGDPDRRSTAAALALLATAAVEGPRSARTHEDWVAWASEPPSAGAEQFLHTHYHSAVSAIACIADEPGTELSAALQALEAAPVGQSELRLLGVASMHHITDDLGGALDEELIAELDRLSSDPSLSYRAAWHMLHGYLHSRNELSHEQKLERLDIVASRARHLGDVRTEISTIIERARVADEHGDTDDALAHMERAKELAESAGFLVVLAAYYQITTQLNLAAGRLDACDALLREAAERVESRGMPIVDGSMLERRFELALARRDAPLVLELTDDMEAWRRTEGELWGSYGALQEQVLSAQRERIERRRLEEEQARDLEERRASLLRGVAFGALGVVALGVVVALRSRRKLLAANRRLQAEIERAEGAVRAREALEERMRQIERTESLGLFASGIAHDFNNLMVGVIGNAELLRLEERDPRRARLIDAIVGAGERAARLCAQLQIYAGGERVELAALDLAGLVRESAPVLAAAVGGGVQVDVEAPAQPLVVQGARSQLEQALLNLVVNARDAGARRVVVRVFRQDIQPADLSSGHAGLVDMPNARLRGELRPGEYVALDVHDQGEGMSRELLERIFDPFFTTRFPGRGLGLAVVFGVLRRHGGVIAVDSVPGAGSRFRLLIPAAGAVASATAPQLAPPSPLPARSPRLRVLVVDDEPDVREFLARLLVARGHSVLTAHDLDSLAEQLPLFDGDDDRVALVDLTMPTADGRDVLAALRRLSRPPAVVFMSGHAASHLEQVARELEVEGHISKPFLADDLERELQRATGVHATRAALRQRA